MADDNGKPQPIAAPAQAGAAAAVAEPAPAPLRKVPVRMMDHKKGFEGTSAMDRFKAYLKEVPVIHARLVKTVSEFETVTRRIQEIVNKWEEEQKDAGHHAPAVGTASPAAAPEPAPAAPGGAEPRG